MGLSQEELANKIGYKDRSTIAKIEAGINDITQSKVVAFANALETTPAWLMGWKDDPERPSRDEIAEKIARVISSEYFKTKKLSADEKYENRVKGLLKYFNRLNLTGQINAIQRVEELTYVMKYVDKDILEATESGNLKKDDK